MRDGVSERTDAASRRSTGIRQLPTGITTVDSAGTLGQKRIAAAAASSHRLLMRCSPLASSLSGGRAGEARWLNRRASFLVRSLQIGSLACPPIMS
ncbi:hypothetical protein CEP54_004994 [Fusarium duplospermum]|uniref:Uncharacterized protein n=1 Tax=Fusarium duplospermum TaxID=1325734 RepID=A0A428QF27_9HYPO|nr:hypothetical protein CEP54_004994 [Fusarium duplospermum]